MWESCLAMFSSSDGLQCKSNGKGTNAKLLTFTPDGDREWIDRDFDGIKGCLYEKCPDSMSKKCKPLGMMKCFPTVDLTPNAYRFETRSINTIMGMESSFMKLWNLLNVAHAIKEKEAGKGLKFDGFFGAKMYLIHKKIKSGLKLKKLFQSQITGLLHYKFLDALNLNKYGQRNDKSIQKFIKRKKLNEINSAFTITNLGICPIPYQYSSTEIINLVAPFVQSDTMEKYISMTTFRGELFISISFNEYIVSKELVNMFLNKSIEILINNTIL